MHKVLLCIVWLLPLNILAQNLVPNPGFELFYDCPSGLRQLNKTKKWFAGNTGTPEYFRTDCKFANGNPYSGRGFVGLILFGGYSDVIEYVGVELTDTLKSGNYYCGSFYIRADDSYMYIDQIGMLITEEKEYVDMWAPIYKSTQILSNYNEPIVPELGWLKVSGEFKANGKMRFLTIGNFTEPDRHVKSINEFSTSGGLGWNSYYFIDDVSIIEIEANQTCADVQIHENRIVNRPSLDTVELANTFYFENDAFVLSQQELERLVHWKIELRSYNIIELTAISSTDSNAAVDYNYSLSVNRSEYILSILGNVINTENLKIENNGELKPVASNSTEKGKQLNRSVKIIVKGFEKQKR